MNRLAALVGLALVTACSEPAAPSRAGGYAFDDPSTGLVFHWPGDRLAIRYFADTRGHMRFLVDRALRTWESQFLYGEFRGVLVSDSADADVIVRWANSVPPDVPPDAGAPVFACDGRTSFYFDSTGVALDSVRAEIGITLGQTFTAAQVAACVRRLAIHELGHTLGILQESPDASDVMNTSVPVDLPSDRDRRTVEMLYHTVPTIAPPPR